MTARSLLYRALFALRHPDAVRIWRQGVDYDQYRRLNRPWLKRLDIRSVLDIGANVGQFARLVHTVLPQATIFSFEPLPECHRELVKALGNYRGFRAINSALGDASGELSFWRSPHTPSSSFLTMTSTHEAAYPESRSGSEVRVRVQRLDDVACELELRDNLFVKIDVQGYEAHVVSGGQATLRRAAAVLIETSFVTLYREQVLFADIVGLMGGLGFRFFGNMMQYDDPRTGCPLFADSVFINDRYSQLALG